MKDKINKLVATTRHLEAVKAFPEYFGEGARDKAQVAFDAAYKACLE